MSSLLFNKSIIFLTIWMQLRRERLNINIPIRKGFGFVEMSAKAEAQSAIEGLNGKDLRGSCEAGLQTALSLLF
jgi:RNA recognition motif-containing protein